MKKTKMKSMAVLLSVCMLGASLTGCGKEIPVEEDNMGMQEEQEQSVTPAEEEEQAEQQEEQGEQTEEQEKTAALAPEEGAELTYWTNNVDFGQAVGEKFEEKYGVPVTVEEVGLDAINKVLLDGPAGNGSDIFMVAHDSFETGYSAGVFMEIDQGIAGKLNNELSPKAMDTVTREGKVYGVPVSAETLALIYNKDLVTEPAGTFEEILEECADFNNPSENKFWFVAFCTSGYGAYPYLSAKGFQLFGEDGQDNDNPGFNTDEFAAGLETVAEFGQAMGLKSSDLVMENGQLLSQNFVDGKVGYYIDGPWTVDYMHNSGVNVGVTTLPTYNGKTLTPFAGVQNAHISAYTEYPNASQLFAEYLASKEGAELLYAKANKITARKDIENIAGLCDDEISRVYAEQFAEAVPMPSSKRMSYYWTITEAVLSAVFDGEFTPEEGAQKAQADFDALVASE